MHDDQTRLFQALEIFQEFGPNRAVPARTRWQAAFADATADDFARWEALFRELEHFAFGVAEQVLDGRLGEADAAARIAARFPMLRRESVGRTLSQALYFASK